MEGGGNCGNVACALSRLGVSVSVVTHLAQDAFGVQIAKELKSEKHINLNHSHYNQGASLSSPFSYIIVVGNSRTCIHTPFQQESEFFEVDRTLLSGANPASLVYFDTRFTQSALEFARSAHEKRVPIMLDLEKVRPDLPKLMELADYVVTNSDFPGLFIGMHDQDTWVCQKHILNIYPNIKFICTTMGEMGCIFMRQGAGSTGFSGGSGFGEKHAGRLAEKLSFRYMKYESGKPLVLVTALDDFNVIQCSAIKLDAEKIVDTTGAGDAFIAGMIYGIINEYDIESTLSIASFLPHEKIKQRGARSGLPGLARLQKYCG